MARALARKGARPTMGTPTRSPRPHPSRSLPRGLKWGYTLFVLFLVPVYTVAHGLANFLWFSNVAMLSMVVVLWRESARLASAMAVLVLVPEAAWNVSFFSRLATGSDPIGLTGYMFDPRHSLLVRGLSLYHVPLPLLLLWVVHRLGYRRTGLRDAVAICWVVLPLTALLAPPGRNINWHRGFGEDPVPRLPVPLQVGLVMVVLPAGAFWPAHRLLSRAFGRAPERAKPRPGA